MCLQIQAWGPCVSCFVGCWKLCPLWNYQFSPFFVSVILRFPIDAHWFNPDSPPSLELCDSVTDFYGVWFLWLETRVFFFLLLHEESLLCNYNVIFFSRGKLGIMAIVSECDACSYVMGDVADLYFRSPSFTLEIGECCHPWSSMDTTCFFISLYFSFFAYALHVHFLKAVLFKISLYLWPSNHICKRSAQHFRICVTSAALIKQIFFLKL